MSKCSSNCVKRLSDEVWNEISVEKICNAPEVKFAILEQMVIYYKIHLKNSTEIWLRSLTKGQPKELWFTNFICGEANISRDPADGKFCKNFHQRRRTAETIKEARAKLEAFDFDQFTSFKDILSKTIDLTKDVNGFGDLCYYDFSLRYGYQRNILPDAVYLHAGVAEGLNILSKIYPEIEVITDKKFGKMITNLSLLPEELSKLEPLHIENFLCIFHDHLLRYLNHHLGIKGEPGPYYGIYKVPKEEQSRAREPKWKVMRRELEAIYREAKESRKS